MKGIVTMRYKEMRESKVLGKAYGGCVVGNCYKPDPVYTRMDEF